MSYVSRGATSHACLPSARSYFLGSSRCLAACSTSVRLHALTATFVIDTLELFRSNLVTMMSEPASPCGDVNACV